jgi:hypothetical protein
MNQNSSTNITVTDVDIPFGRLVGLILKIMLASIPALIVFYLLVGAVTLVLFGIFGGGAALLKNLPH